jgi:co-chaperonin GroES (HSP10)
LSNSIRFEAENIPVDKLPKPVGWRLIVGMIKMEKETNGGIILLEESIEKEKYIRCLGKVLAIGNDCYKHPKFQGGIDLASRQPEHWAKVGDTVLIGAYVGMAITLVDEQGDKQTVKVLNDDEILAVIPDISAILT